MNPDSDILSKIQIFLKTDNIQNDDCICVYDVLKLYKNKDKSLKTIEEKYFQQMRRKINSEINSSAHVFMKGFNYDTKELILNYSKYFISEPEKIIFSKKDNDLYITNHYRKNITEELLLAIGDIISELYDKYIDFENFYLQESLNIKSVNSDFMVDINKGNVKIYDNLNSEYEFVLEWDSTFEKYKYVCNSYTLLNFIQGKEEALLKKVFVKINDCPKWMQKQLYETRKFQLLESKTQNDVSEKKELEQIENYNVLLNEIKKYINKEEVNKLNYLIEIISLFELYNIVNEEMEDLRNFFKNSKFEKKFKSYTFVDNFQGITPNFFVDFDKSRSLIYLRASSTLIVYKDKFSDDIYFDDFNDNNTRFYKFVKKNHDLVLKTLLLLEHYSNLIGEKQENKMTFNDNLFSVTLNFDEYGKVDIIVDINKKHPLKDEYYKKWYERENIFDFVNKNKEDILKRFMIDPSSLKEPFLNIYNAHKEKEIEIQKVKAINKK